MKELGKEFAKPLIPGYAGISAYKFNKEFLINKTYNGKYFNCLIEFSSLGNGVGLEVLTLGLFASSLLSPSNDLSLKIEIGAISLLSREIIYHGCNILRERIEKKKETSAESNM